MPPKRTRRAVVHDEPTELQPGSGQDAESLAKDLAAQPELYAAAAELLKRQRSEAAAIQSNLEAPATSTKKKSKKARTALLNELISLDDLLWYAQYAGFRTSLVCASKNFAVLAFMGERRNLLLAADPRGRASALAIDALVARGATPILFAACMWLDVCGFSQISPVAARATLTSRAC